ncbi:MAG: fatty acid desaturase [Myxococcales bacterium]|nr:fatty acid desaturase [Myxococcales bacterium]
MNAAIQADTRHSPKTMPTPAEWRAATAPFRQPDVKASVWQIVNTTVPYVLSSVAAYALFPYSFWLSFPFTVLAALLTVRLFILAHDCGHGAFFKSQRANDIVGFWTGALSYTPYWMWRHMHALHHAHSGDVEHAGIGYFWTMSISEYRNSPWYVQLGYRAYRHPFTLFVIGGTWLFAVEYRFPIRKADGRMIFQTITTNLVWAAIFTLVWVTVGPLALLGVALPMAAIAGTLGLWLFYVQHHYPDSYWGKGKQWDYTRAALEGSSFLKLPKWAQFFSGNIGFHHIHHLAPKVPNYKLEACNDAVPAFKAVEPLTLSDALKGLSLTLVDDETMRWVTFADERRTAPKAETGAPANPGGAAR